MSSSDDAIVGKTLDGTIIAWNKGAERLYGYRAEEALGKHISIIVPLDRSEELAGILDTIRGGGGVERLETVRLKSDGTRVEVALTISPIQDRADKLVGASVIARDISDRKRAEHELRRTTSELQEAQRIARIGFWTWDPKLDKVHWSEEIFHAFGLEAKQPPPSVGGSAHLYTPESRAHLEAVLQEAVQHGTPYEIDLQVIRPDGSRRWITARGEAQRDDRGQVAMLRGTMQDITDRKRQEDDLSASLQEKEMLLKEIHHRVKNNLQVISSLLQLGGGGGREGKFIEILRESQFRVRTMALIHEKLYQSKDFAHIDFGEYVRSLATDLFHSYRPDPDTVSLSVRADQVLLGVDAAIPCALIVNELVSNCLKHAFCSLPADGVAGAMPIGSGQSEDSAGAPRRRGTVCVELGLKGNNRVQLVVADNGAGFPKSLDFRHTESLGLQLVNTLTGQLGGTIELHTEFGTEFRIEFPA